MDQEFRYGSPVKLTTTVRDAAGTAVDPADLVLVLRDPDGVETTVAFAALTNEAGTGVWSYTTAALTTPGAWTYEFSSTTPTGVDEGTFSITGSAIGGTASNGAGPCTAWCTPADLVADGWTAPTAASQALRQACCDAASGALYELVGRRWPGVCWASEIPATCSWGGYLGGVAAPGKGNVYASAFPAVLGGHGPACGGYSRAYVAGSPIVNVDAVRLDGVTLDAALYEVVDGAFLVRVDGASWPCCIDPSTSPPRMAVDYTFGSPPPVLGSLAAVALARQLVLAVAAPDTCALDRRVRSVTREGVSMELAVPGLVDSLAGGFTGVPEVDLLIASYNPNRLRASARVLVPGQSFPSRLG